jgi:hypothetical protein
MAELYENASRIFKGLPPQHQVQLRVLLVDTDKKGIERKVEEGENVQPVRIDPATKRALLEIHPGRLGVQTVDGNKLVAQVAHKYGENILFLFFVDISGLGRRRTKLQI